MANSRKFPKYSRGLLDRFLIFDKSVVTEIIKLSEDYEKVFVLVSNDFLLGPSWCRAEYRQIKRRCSNVYFVLFYIDIVGSIFSLKANCLRENYPDMFDLMYTPDKMDANKYGLIYYQLPYAFSFKNEADVLNQRAEKDLSFCAHIKKRSQLILDILKGCKENDVSVTMSLFTDKESEKQPFMKYSDTVTLLQRFKKYDEIIGQTLSAGCLLDIVQDGQTALTMRPYEAVFFNRKLLTNNPTIFDFQYYNPSFIQFFSDPNEICWEWVKEKTVVDYGYKGDFSPNHLWKDIEMRLL